MKRLFGLLAVLAIASVPWSGAGAEEATFEKYTRIIGYDAFAAYAVIPVRDDVVIVDSRPAKKRYDKGHVPGAINIPNTFFDKKVDMLPADKETRLIFYCGGPKCPLSLKSATKAKALGHTDVVLFQAGYPAWKKAYGEGEKAGAAAGLAKTSQAAPTLQVGPDGDTITIPSFKEIMAKAPDSVRLIDVRDPKEYDKAHFKDVANIPVEELEDQVADLPGDKPIVFVCATGARSSEAYDIVKMTRADMAVYYVDGEITFNPDGSFDVKPAE